MVSLVTGSEADPRETAPASYSETIRARLRIGEMPPERYVALKAHRWMLAGPLVYRYQARNGGRLVYLPAGATLRDVTRRLATELSMCFVPERIRIAPFRQSAAA
jgi:hypothetical protein